MTGEALVTLLVIDAARLGYKTAVSPGRNPGNPPFVDLRASHPGHRRPGRPGLRRARCATLASTMADDLSTAPADDDPAGRLGDGKARPAAVTAVAVALGLEALVLVGLAVVGVLDLFGSGERAVGLAVGLVVAALLVAWLLGACARGLLAGLSWVRGPAMTLQILALLVALSLVQGGLRALPAVVTVVAGATFVGLVLPAVAAYTRRDTLPFADED